MKSPVKFLFVLLLGVAVVLSAQVSYAADMPSKVISIAYAQSAAGLDPHDTNGDIAVAYANVVYEGFVAEDREGNYFPRLAERWESNEAGDKWRFFLRKGVKFHDGEAFDAKDVKCTFDRLLANKTRSRIAATYWSTLVSCEIVDDYTVDLTFDGPNPRCLPNAANTPIIQNEAFEKYGDELWSRQILNGTGPWIFKEWIDGQYIHVLKNQDYWNKAEYDSYYEELYLRSILEPSTRVAAHLAGDVQVNLSQGGVTRELRTLYEGTEDRIRRIELKTGQFYYVMFQCAEDHPLGNRNARMAFEYCLDRKNILDNILDGDGELTSSVITGPVWGFDPNLPLYEYNPEKAREFLKQSNYAGQKITLTSYTAIKRAEEVLLAMAENMTDVGFNVDIEIIELSVMLERRATGKYDLFYAMHRHNSNDATESLLLRFDQGREGHNFVNAEMHDLIEKLTREMDADKRAAYVSRISHIMREEAAPASAVCSNNVNYYADWGVTGIAYYRDGGIFVTYVDYDPSLVPAK